MSLMTWFLYRNQAYLIIYFRIWPESSIESLAFISHPILTITIISDLLFSSTEFCILLTRILFGGAFLLIFDLVYFLNLISITVKSGDGFSGFVAGSAASRISKARGEFFIRSAFRLLS